MSLIQRAVHYFHRNTVRRLRADLTDRIAEHTRALEEAYVLQQMHADNAAFYSSKADFLARVIAGQRERLDGLEFTPP